MKAKACVCIAIFSTVWCAAVLGASAPTASITATGKLEKLLFDNKTADINPVVLAQVIALKTEAPDTAVQSAVLRMCAAGYLYSGNDAIYNKTLRNQIENVETFEEAVCAACQKCKGAKSVESTCTQCKGTGRCTTPGCNGGTMARYDLARSRSYQGKCGSCNGTGGCLKCLGKGAETSQCSACRGRGSIFTKTAALAVYRKELAGALALFSDGRKAAVDAIAQREEAAENKAKQKEHEAALRAAEVAAKKDAVVAEAKALGEERARQMVATEKAEKEQTRKELTVKKHAERDSKYRKSIVLITGQNGDQISWGTGFLCLFNGRKVVVSNAHVLCGNRTLLMKTISNKEVKFSKIMVCNDRDAVTYEVTNTNDFEYLQVYDRVEKMGEEDIVMFGNSHGKGVVTTERGQMKGLGPTTIEMDAKGVAGNSGSPILAYDYDAVVGMYTYITPAPAVIDWKISNTRYAEPRRFGVRLDNLTDKDFTPLNIKEYNQALDIFDLMTGFKVAIFEAASQGVYVPNAKTRKRAAELMELYKTTPVWMRPYAEEAWSAFVICEYVATH